MKSLLGLLRPGRSASARGHEEARDSDFFATGFSGPETDAARRVPWTQRAHDIGARRILAAPGTQALQRLWAHDRHMGRLAADGIARMEPFLEFVSVPAQRELIRQDEYGDFMLVVLEGTIAVDRRQPGGECLRLAETRPGDLLGEMSLLDGGIRFSSCTTLARCEIAVLSAEALDRMTVAEPHTAASLVALLARKLSLRLRTVSARLSGEFR